jgi:hypothetical protein
MPSWRSKLLKWWDILSWPLIRRPRVAPTQSLMVMHPPYVPQWRSPVQKGAGLGVSIASLIFEVQHLTFSFFLKLSMGWRLIYLLGWGRWEERRTYEVRQESPLINVTGVTRNLKMTWKWHGYPEPVTLIAAILHVYGGTERRADYLWALYSMCIEPNSNCQQAELTGNQARENTRAFNATLTRQKAPKLLLPSYSLNHCYVIIHESASVKKIYPISILIIALVQRMILNQARAASSRSYIVELLLFNFSLLRIFSSI